MKEVEREEIGVYTIAKLQKITPRWARELPRKYKDKEIVLKKPGRKAKQIPTNEKNKAECDYQKKVKSVGVKQIFARPAHPRSNGKNEKLNGTIKRLMKKGKSLKEAIELYNFKKPHLALDTAEGKLRTPYQAFLDKMRK